MAKNTARNSLLHFILGVAATNFAIVESVEARPLLGYQNHEFVFMEKAFDLRGMTQEKANATCIANWEHIRTDPDFYSEHPELQELQARAVEFHPYVWHIWGHKNNGHCVLNHNAWGKFYPYNYQGEYWQPFDNGKIFTLVVPIFYR
jgi:hypothetical protein